MSFLHNKNLISAAAVSTSTAKILSGDLNTATTSELEYITSKGFHDTISSSDMDSAVESMKSATVGLTFPVSKYIPRRSDFILYRGNHWSCIDHTHFGNNPVVKSDGSPLECLRGAQGCLYPSDHLAVLARFINLSPVIRKPPTDMIVKDNRI
jgi:hypothetical protein